MTLEPDLKLVDILLVEDNPGDVRLIQESFKEAKMMNNLYVASNGEEALNFLFRKSPHADAPTPDLIMLDLNLPRKNGHEVLEAIKHHQELKYIPVVILTSSREEKDVLKSYDLHANCYVTKPVDFGRFMEVVQTIETFWLSIVKLPRRRRNH